MGENPFSVTGNVTVTAGRTTVITNVENSKEGVRGKGEARLAPFGALNRRFPL